MFFPTQVDAENLAHISSEWVHLLHLRFRDQSRGLQFQNFGGAELHALWLFSAAQVAFDGNIFCWVNGDRPKWASLHAGATADTTFFIDENKITYFADRSDWAGIAAGWSFALHANNRVISNRLFFDDPNAAGPYSEFFVMGIHTSNDTRLATGTTFACICDFRHSCTFINRSDGRMPLKSFRKVSVLGF
jgi:hypothetical protein